MVALLRHSLTDVTAGFHVACGSSQVSIAKLLLYDSRCGGKLSVWGSTQCGHVIVVKWIIASGRDVDLDERDSSYPWEGEEREEDFNEKEYTPIEIARLKGHIEMASLLERFQSDPDQTRQAIKRELHVTGGGWLVLSYFFFLFSSS